MHREELVKKILGNDYQKNKEGDVYSLSFEDKIKSLRFSGDLVDFYIFNVTEENYEVEINDIPVIDVFSFLNKYRVPAKTPNDSKKEEDIVSRIFKGMWVPRKSQSGSEYTLHCTSTVQASVKFHSKGGYTVSVQKGKDSVFLLRVYHASKKETLKMAERAKTLLCYALHATNSFDREYLSISPGLHAEGHRFSIEEGTELGPWVEYSGVTSLLGIRVTNGFYLEVYEKYIELFVR